MRETAVLHRILLECGHGDVRLFRNNVGQYKDDEGNVIRYGVFNPGGHDLIGWKTVTITPEMVGQRVAVFATIEVKGDGGKPTEKQEEFADIVAAAGGITGFAWSPADAMKVLHGEQHPR